MQDTDLCDRLADKDETARAQIARRVGAYLSIDDLPETERKAAEYLAQELVGDAVERVRRELSDSVKHAKFLPKTVALEIAHDVDAVACPFLAVAEVFSESDWQELVLTISRRARVAVAARASLTEAMAVALAETGDSEVAGVLVDNAKLPVTPPLCHALIERYEDSPEILDRLGRRGNLDAEIVVRLIEKVSATTREKLVETYHLPDHTAPIVTEAELAAILHLIREAPESDLRPWALRLKKEGRLNGTFLLMAARDDALAFFETALSVLSGARLERARTVVRHEGKESVVRLLQGAHMPSAMSDDFWTAILQMRQSRDSA